MTKKPSLRKLTWEVLEPRLVLTVGATIDIDGDFTDWNQVAGASGTDPVDDQHDTDHDQLNDIPAYVEHPDVDLLEYRVSHDAENLYFYFKSTGIIGNTQAESGDARAGRFYVIVTIDVDQNDTTGYPLHEGGYYPTTPGYDANAELEFFNGEFNTGHYINHGALNQEQLDQAFLDQTLGAYVAGNDGPYSPGFVEILPGNYDFYTQWVYQENNPTTDSDDQIVFVRDKGPIVEGIVSYALSADGHELEMKAPLKGFLIDQFGNPIIGLGSTLDLSFSLEASGELANVSAQNPNGEWASDTADPIYGYYVAPPNNAPSFTLTGNVDVDQFSGPQTIEDFAQNLSKGAASEDEQVLTFHVENDDQSLFSQQPAIDPETGDLTFTPVAGAVGSALVTVRLSDDGGNDFGGNDESATLEFLITINPAPGISAVDNSGSASDHSVRFTTPLSQYRPGAQDSNYVRPALADQGHSLTVTNAGAAPLTLYELQINVPDVSVDVPLTGAAGDDIVLGSGESQTFQLTFAPSLPSAMDPSSLDFSIANGIVLFSDAVNTPQMQIELFGMTTFNSDTNYDGIVNFGDLGIMNANFGLASGDPDYDPSADPNNDGIVNFTDLGLLNAEFGRDVNNPAPSIATNQSAKVAVTVGEPQPLSPQETLVPIPAGKFATDLLEDDSQAVAAEVARLLSPKKALIEPVTAVPRYATAEEAAFAELGGGGEVNLETLLFDFESGLPWGIPVSTGIA